MRDLNDVADLAYLAPGIAELRPREENVNWLSTVDYDQWREFFALQAATVIRGWRFVDLYSPGALELPQTSNPNDLGFHGHPGEIVLMSADNVVERTRRTVLARDPFVLAAYVAYLKSNPDFFPQFRDWLDGLDDVCFKSAVPDWRDITLDTFPAVMMRCVPNTMCKRFPDMMGFMVGWIRGEGEVVYERRHDFNEAFALGDSAHNGWSHGALGSQISGGALQVNRFSSPLS